MFDTEKEGVCMSVLRMTLMMVWILMLGTVAALRYLISTKLPFAKRKAAAADGPSEY